MKNTTLLWLGAMTFMVCMFYEADSQRDFKVQMAALKYTCEKVETNK